jgi:hypothetical protein
MAGRLHAPPSRDMLCGSNIQHTQEFLTDFPLAQTEFEKRALICSAATLPAGRTRLVH